MYASGRLFYPSITCPDKLPVAVCSFQRVIHNARAGRLAQCYRDSEAACLRKLAVGSCGLPDSQVLRTASEGSGTTEPASHFRVRLCPNIHPETSHNRIGKGCGCVDFADPQCGDTVYRVVGYTLGWPDPPPPETG